MWLPQNNANFGIGMLAAGARLYGLISSRARSTIGFGVA
jgi:hypothetical protein